MSTVLASISLGYKDSAWFSSNPSFVLKEGQIVYLQQTGTYKIGDGITDLTTLSFLGGGGAGSVTSVNGQTGVVVLTTNDITNNSGYITSSAVASSYVPYTGATGSVNLGTNTITFGSASTSGTAGAGFINLGAQSSNPTAPSVTGVRLYATSAGNLAWNRRPSFGTDMFMRTLAGVITADRTYLLPDVNITIAGLNGGQTFTSAIWQASSISTTYTDAKIKGAISANSGRIILSNGTADTVTSNSNLSWDGDVLYQVTATNFCYHRLTQASSDTIIGNRLGQPWIVLNASSFRVNQIISTLGNTFISNWNINNGYPDAAARLEVNAGDGTDHLMLSYDSSNYGLFKVSSAGVMTINATGGTIFGDTAGLISFYGASPVAQQDDSITGAIVSFGIGTPITEDTLIGGYTVPQMFAALIRLGVVETI